MTKKISMSVEGLKRDALKRVRRAPRFIASTPQRILIFAIRIYRWTISPAQIFLFGANSGCRFTPTCSQYAVEAIQRHGAMPGTFLAAKRICRCHPLGNGGHDPVPGKNPRPAPRAPRFI